MAEPRRAPKPILAIEHVESSNPEAPTFKLTRLSDGKSLQPTTVSSPYATPIPGGHPGSLMTNLRWYLENFLDYPFPPETTRAEHTLDALKLWGTQVFNGIFDRRDAGSWLSNSDILQIRSDDAAVLSWPWEALFDPLAGSYAAHQHRIERRLNSLPDPPALAATLPTDRVNILLVVSRPYAEKDVRYRSLARPLIELIESQNLPAHVDVLRPPTFDNLRNHLRAHPGFYHVLHFDGHGAFGNSNKAAPSPHKFRAPEGCLVFENANAEQDPKAASALTALLREHAVPTVVLNACQSAALNEQAENPFSSVATALLQSGMRSVVAMAYSLYVSGAQVFLPAFYRRLFESKNVAEATRAGRQQMFSEKKRMSPRGPFDLEDWLLPVLYQQEPMEFTFDAEAKQAKRNSRLPENLSKHKDPYGFIGRDRPILEMERALQRKTPCILLQGLGGVGKTTLARGFLRWLDATGGLDAALWFDFRDIRTSEFVINQTGQLFYGENFGAAESKLGLLTEACSKYRLVIVWDNFESTAQNLSSEDRSELGSFLDAIQGTRSKVILTSRSREEWLGSTRRFELPLGGLDGEERWEYCDFILRELGLASRVDRSDVHVIRLMNQLEGHPLAMRVVLPRLERMTAAQILAALRTNLKDLGLDEKEDQGRVFATLRFVEQGLAPELQPLLGVVGLHDSYVNADLMEAMSQELDPAWTRQRIDLLMAALSAAGLLRSIGQATYEMHPFLTSYLRSRAAAPASVQRSFVKMMAAFAVRLVDLQPPQRRLQFHLHSSSFYFAWDLARSLSLGSHSAALTRSLALQAQYSRNFPEASRLFSDLAQQARVDSDHRSEAFAFRKLGDIAHEQRDFSSAREWCFKSLAISEAHKEMQTSAVTYHLLGIITADERDFVAAREWYLKSLVIVEKLQDWQNVASSYHELGMIAYAQNDFPSARDWYLKSLAISERERDLETCANTYHQLGIVTFEQRDLNAAQDWYLKALLIWEKLGHWHHASSAYHELGITAEAARDFPTAHEWHLKSLAIKERQGNLLGASNSYRQLGRIAREQFDFATSRDWFLKSLAITDKQANVHSSAITYGELAFLEGMDGETTLAGQWLIRAIHGFLRASDIRSAQKYSLNFARLHQGASPAIKPELEAIWREANLGPFPEIPE